MNRYKYRYVDKGHYVCEWRASHPELECARVFFPKDMTKCTHALVVHGPMHMIAFLRFWHTRGRLYAGGTWVEESARGKGIAGALWRRVLEKFEPRRVFVHTISNEGRRLVSSLVRDNPGIAWEINT